MNTKIDWYSFSFPTVPTESTEDPLLAVGDGLCAILDAQTIIAMRVWKWEPIGHGRAPYTEGWTVKGSHVTLWTNPALPHATFEATGQGCEWLRECFLLEEIVTATAHRATRIDIAVDIPGSTTPADFVAAGFTRRIKTSAYLTSSSGNTVYVGSQKSDAFARVYRYNPPHPRSDKLRIEMVHRRERAKDMAARWAIAGAEACKSACYDTYRWEHATWAETGTPDPLQSAFITDARSSAGTVRWLINQVAPAFKRLVADGSIKDPEAFLWTYFREPVPW